MIRTQISMTEDQAARLRRLAAVRQRSQAALLRDALDQLLGNDDRQRRIDRAKAAIGRFSSGTSDTATRHDDVLEDAYA
jgi:predicted transcriptional regulator